MTVLKRVLLSTLAFVGTLGAPQRARAIGAGDANTIFDAWNKALLIRSGGDVFYRSRLNEAKPDKSWTGSLDILVAIDAYERTGDPNRKTLVNDLLNTWLKNNRPPWDWNWWNDDLGWYANALVRGYLVTGNAEFLKQAKYGFDHAFNRGWDTKYNGGGIWEENPEGTAKEKPPKEPTKEALSNDSLGKVACLIYQATHDSTYLSKCKQIYDWVHSRLYNANTGQINTGIDKQNKLQTGAAAYNRGTFLDYAAILFECTGTSSYKADAQKALDFARSDKLTKSGIYSNDGTQLNTWADEVARGAGRFIHDHQLWDTYHPWFIQNAEAIMKNRRSDRGITDNAWSRPTPKDDTAKANVFASAVAWLQYTPATNPGKIGGIHYIVNKKTGQYIDNENTYGDGKRVVQWSYSGWQTQRWQFSQNSDGTWNIISLASFKALDNPNGSKDDGKVMVQWSRNRNSNQRWLVEPQSDGSYAIKNQASGKYLDGASSTANGGELKQWGWNGQDQQRWILKQV